MKNQDKQNKQAAEEKQEHQQTVNDYFDRETGQPIPQPKDYEEIDY